MFKSNTLDSRSLKQKLLQTIKFASIGVLFGLSLITSNQAQVQGAPSTTLNFQARLLSASGAIVPDGNYHVEFSLYDDVSGGTALWTETRTTGNLVSVKNGYLSVYLGSVNAFPSTIDWSDDLFLTMTIGGAGGAASWDNEMNPRIKLTAVPYAFQSAQAVQLAKTSGANQGTLGFNTLTGNRSIVLPDASGTVCLEDSVDCGFVAGAASDFIQNGTAQQSNANFNIAASAGVAATIEGAAGQNIFELNQNGGTAALTISSVGNATFAGDLAVGGGDITSTGALNITPGGAMTLGSTTQSATLQGSTVSVTSTGSGNDIALTSADQIILTGKVDANGVMAVGNNQTTHDQYALRVGHTFNSGSACGFFGCFGIDSRVTLDNPVSPSLATGIASQIILTNSTALTDAYGLHIWSPDVQAGSSITNNYGIRVGVQSGGATDYGLYVEGSDDYGIYLNYGAAFGTNTPNYGLYVKNADTYAIHVDDGATRLDGTLQVGTLGATDTDAVLCRNSSDQLAACSSTFATSTDLAGYVQLQSTTPGTAQTGNLNIDGTGIFGTALSTGTLATTGNATIGGNLTIDDSDIFAGEKILAAFNNDFSGTGEGTYFQNMYADTNTYLQVRPNGAGTESGISFTGNDADSIGIMSYTGSEFSLTTTNAAGSPAGVPISFKIKAASGAVNTIMSLNSTGNATIGSTALQGSMTLHDGDGQTATISVGNALAANTTLAIPTGVGATDTFCMQTLANCAASATSLQSAYETGNTILATDAEGDIDFTVSEATNFTVDITGTGSFQVQDAGTAVFTVADGGNASMSGDLALGGSATIGGDLTFAAGANHTISVATPPLDNGSDLTIRAGHGTASGDHSGGDLILQGGNGNGTSAAGAVIVQSPVNAGDNPVFAIHGGDFTNQLTFAEVGTAAVLSLGQGNGGSTINLRDDGVTNWGISTSDAGTFGGTDHLGFYLGGSTQVLGLSGTDGSAIFRNSANSTTAFQVQNAAGTSVLTVDTSGSELEVNGVLTVAGLTTLNGGLTVETGDTLTFNGDAITDFTGQGLVVSSGALTVDNSALDDNFFIQGGNSFGTGAVLGTNDTQSLAFETDGTTRLTIDTSGNATFTGDLLGGTVQGDSLVLSGSNQAWDIANKNTVDINNSQLRFTGQNTITSNTIDSLINFDETVVVSPGNDVIGLTGFNFKPTVQYSTSQTLSSFPAFWANQEYQATAGGISDAAWNVFAGFYSSPRYSINHSGGSGTTDSFSGYVSQPVLEREAGQTGTHTITNVNSYLANQTILFGNQISNMTATNWAGFRSQNVVAGTGGVITNQYGIRIDNLTTGVNDYGMVIDGADTYALWTKRGAVRMATTNSADAFQLQNGDGANILSVDASQSNNLAVNPGAEVNITGWSAHGGGSAPTRTTTSGQYASGVGGVARSATSASHGVRNSLGAALAINTKYSVSFSVKSTTSMSDLTVAYYRNNTPTLDVACGDYSSQSADNTGFKKVTCTFTTSGTAGNTTAFLAIYQAGAGTRSIYIDNLSIVAITSSSTAATIRVGGPASQGLTLLTLDSYGERPWEGSSNALYGSIYYDTTLGKIQCYEADGWGACGGAPDNIVNLVPEYAGSVLNGTGVGTMTADLCNDGLGVNDGTGGSPTYCATGQSYNYYKWTSPQASAQTYSIYISYQLPATFNGFADANTIKLTGRRTSSSASVVYQLYEAGGAQCGSDTTVTSSDNTWQTVELVGDETQCTFAANDVITFRINMTASDGASAFSSNFSFTTLGK